MNIVEHSVALAQEFVETKTAKIGWLLDLDLPGGQKDSVWMIVVLCNCWMCK